MNSMRSPSGINKVLGGGILLFAVIIAVGAAASAASQSINPQPGTGTASMPSLDASTDKWFSSSVGNFSGLQASWPAKKPDSTSLQAGMPVGMSRVQESFQLLRSQTAEAGAASQLVAINSQMDRRLFYGGSMEGTVLPGGAVNYLDITVSPITVLAINAVEGGTAVARSELIIRPVQIVICPPSEMNDKVG
ncbi:MAG: hypothetical protein A4E47_00557 [Methanosaeta sp. PtaU1.Bin028]|nr:MAG: hypothetical protein A4E47_00557 [Methanosaeta sp. PtaU1.Bin028]